MANGDVTDDNPEMGQAAPGGAPPAPPTGAPDPTQGGGGDPSGGGNLAAFARSRMGPQVSAPGPGNMADSMTTLQQAIQLIQQAALGLPPGSPLHRDALRAASQLSRHLGGAAGMAPGAGVLKTSLGDQLRHTVRNMMLQRVLGMKGQGPGQGSNPPMPSTPLPGS